MIVAAWIFLALTVVAVVTFVLSWAYDSRHDYNSDGAKRLGLYIALPLFVVLAVVTLVLFDSAHEDEPSTKITIECVVGDDQTLTCEVVE